MSSLVEIRPPGFDPRIRNINTSYNLRCCLLFLAHVDIDDVTHMAIKTQFEQGSAILASVVLYFTPKSPMQFRPPTGEIPFK